MPLVRKNGQLVEVSAEEAQQLGATNQLKQPANPLQPGTPASTASAGGNPDQAKMSGTPNQKQAVTQAAVSGANDLATQNRVNQFKPQKATEEEVNTSSAADRLRSLGGLQSRVESQVQANLASIQQAHPTVNTEALKGVLADPAQLPAAQKAMADYAADPTNQAKADAVRLLIGGQDPNKFLNTDLGAQAAAGAEDKVVLGGVKDLGMSEQEIASILGPNWKSMDLAALDKAVQTLSANQFGASAAAQAQLADVNATANREQVANLAQHQAVVGLANKEEAVQKLSQSLTALDEKTQALLADDNISQQVMQFLSDPKNSTLAKDYPGLAKWATENKAHLDQISEQVTGSTAAATKQAAANAAAFDLPAGVPALSDAVKAALGGAQGSKAANTGVAELLKGMSVDQASEASYALNDIVGHDASAGAALAGIPKAQLQNLMESGRLASYARAVRQHQDLDKLGSDPDKLMDFVFGHGMTQDQAMQSYQVDQKLASHGDSEAQNRVEKFQALLDKDKDGQLDPAKDIKDRLKGMQDKGKLPSLTDVAKGKSFKVNDYGVTANDAPSRDATAKAYDSLSVVSDKPEEFLAKDLPAKMSQIQELQDWETKHNYDPSKPHGGGYWGALPDFLGNKQKVADFVGTFSKLASAQSSLQQQIDTTSDPKAKSKLSSFMAQITAGLDEYKKLKPFIDAEGGENALVSNAYNKGSTDRQGKKVS